MKATKKILENGLRIITIPDSNSLAATVLVLVEAGSKYETKEINGLSHFLEHMCFKGTTKRPKAIDISFELDSIGSQYNAFTSQEYTGYYAKVQARYFDKALDIVSDLYLNPVFDVAEIEKEKGVIVEEINMYEDIPQRKIQDLIMKLMYGDQPAGWSIAGEKDIVTKLTKEQFLSYRGKHYVAKATTVIVAGKFDEDSLYNKIAEKFSDIKADEKHCKPKTTEEQSRPAVLVFNKESDQTHLVFGVRSYDIFDPRYYALEVLAGILGGGMSSRLFQKIREEMGAAYYVHSSHNAYSDHGILEVAAGVDHKKIIDVIKAILVEMTKLKSDLVSEKELTMVKDFIIGNMFLSLETSDAIANFYGGQEILKKTIIDPDEMASEIKKVSAEDIKRVANEIFINNKLNMALVGPFKEEAEFLKVLNL